MTKQPREFDTPEELFDEYLRLIAEERKQEREDELPTPFRLSASGMCTRRGAYMKHFPEKEELSAEQASIFELGDIMHAVERGKMMQFGFPLHSVESDVYLTVPMPEGQEALRIKGHVDGILTIGREDWLMDIKTMGAASFDRFLREGISPEYRAQLNSYLHALGLTKAVLWAYCKDNSKRKMVQYYYDPAFQERIFDHFRTIHNHKPGDDFPPPMYEPYEMVRQRKGTGIMVLYWKCNYCQFREMCWPEFVQDPASDKPRFIHDTNQYDF